ncbi:ribonuclease-like [Lissotriton helveticus]
MPKLMSCVYNISNVASLLFLHFPVLLLAVASVTCAFEHCKPPAGETPYQQFLRQHYDDPKTSGRDYCGKMMLKRCMTNQDPPLTKCKELNSFIHATKKQIQAVCNDSGSPYGNNPKLTVSNLPFRVTTCTCHGDPDVHPCEYRGRETTRRIVIDCRGGNPVHFAEGIVVPN